MADATIDFRNDLAMTTVAIFELLYIGLPPAVAVGKRFDTIGYDYESTAYPPRDGGGVHCRPDERSGIAWRRDFHVGASLGRVKPGGRDHLLSTGVIETWRQ